MRAPLPTGATVARLTAIFPDGYEYPGFPGIPASGCPVDRAGNGRARQAAVDRPDARA